MGNTSFLYKIAQLSIYVLLCVIYVNCEDNLPPVATPGDQKNLIEEQEEEEKEEVFTTAHRDVDSYWDNSDEDETVQGKETDSGSVDDREGDKEEKDSDLKIDDEDTSTTDNQDSSSEDNERSITPYTETGDLNKSGADDSKKKQQANINNDNFTKTSSNDMGDFSYPKSSNTKFIVPLGCSFKIPLKINFGRLDPLTKKDCCIQGDTFKLKFIHKDCKGCIGMFTGENKMHKLPPGEQPRGESNENLQEERNYFPNTYVWIPLEILSEDDKKFLKSQY